MSGNRTRMAESSGGKLTLRPECKAVQNAGINLAENHYPAENDPKGTCRHVAFLRVIVSAAPFVGKVFAKLLLFDDVISNYAFVFHSFLCGKVFLNQNIYCILCSFLTKCVKYCVNCFKGKHSCFK